MGLNVSDMNIDTLSSNEHQTSFEVRISTSDRTTANVIEHRLATFISNLGDTADITVYIDQHRRTEIDNADF